MRAALVAKPPPDSPSSVTTTTVSEPQCGRPVNADSRHDSSCSRIASRIAPNSTNSALDAAHTNPPNATNARPTAKKMIALINTFPFGDGDDDSESTCPPWLLRCQSESVPVE